MALAAFLEIAEASSAGLTSYPGTGFTPGGSRPIIVGLISAGTAPGVNVSLDSPTWLDGVWTKEITDPDNTLELTVFSGRTIASPSADGITMDFEADVQTGIAYAIVSFTGADATDAVVQDSTARGVGTSGTDTLDSALASVNNATLGFIAHEAQEAQTPTGGETELGETGHAAPTRTLSVQWEINDNDSGASWTTSADWIVGVLEIAAAADGFKPQIISYRT